ncbi:SAM-dependent methyltransferase [Flavobacterium sp. CG_9.10]|uniref:class I SAM-dependent methyltransferase n=1 Tax=Flavobacterium sp. CG_9.10 TaxID=2787729 RepID=UPI0018CAC1F8|nr:class I SAM-dependent methyltransferase [Flavobacterium sp. CG_9.10]MBG6109790.1 SAM-dependent methyltransferase [Flavobacterium sp. CG_9.10]
MYSEGIYFENPNRHSEDGIYKVKSIKKVLFNYLKTNNIQLSSYADVGCGSGEIIKLLGMELKMNFQSLKTLKGFDVSPHVKKLNDDNVEFLFQDFTKSTEKFDLVTLNDVFEHVPNPISFLTEVGKRAKYVVMHIPLEDCLSVNVRNLQKKKIKDPGHLVFLNVNSAFNLITFSGLKIVDYDYSIDSINAPSNNTTVLQKIAYPFKYSLLKINPYLFSKIFGSSLIVIAEGIL